MYEYLASFGFVLAILAVGVLWGAYCQGTKNKRFVSEECFLSSHRQLNKYNNLRAEQIGDLRGELNKHAEHSKFKEPAPTVSIPVTGLSGVSKRVSLYEAVRLIGEHLELEIQPGEVTESPSKLVKRKVPKKRRKNK